MAFLKKFYCEGCSRECTLTIEPCYLDETGKTTPKLCPYLVGGGVRWKVTDLEGERQ